MQLLAVKDPTAAYAAALLLVTTFSSTPLKSRAYTPTYV